MTYRVYGVVQDTNGTGVPELDVELWEDYGIPPPIGVVPWTTPRAVVETDYAGAFTAIVDDLALHNHPPTLYFRVVDQGTLLIDTQGTIEWTASSTDTSIVIQVTPLPEDGDCCPRYVIRGIVKTSDSPGPVRPLPGWTVELWEQTATWVLPRATTTTDGAGRFQVELEANVFATMARVVRFRVANNGVFIGPDPTVTWSPASLDHDVTIIISGGISPVRTHVEGYVRSRDGTPQSGLTVNAAAVQMRTETVVGTATTDANGHYVIDCNYLGAKFDLILRAFQVAVDVADSALIVNAPQLLYVDLVLGNVPSQGPPSIRPSSQRSMPRVGRSLPRI